MYLSLKQHDLFRTLLMGFEVPFRSFVSEIILNSYDTYEKFRNTLIAKKNVLSSSDPIFLRNTLPQVCSDAKCKKLYDSLMTANNNKGVNVIVIDQDVPMVGALNIVHSGCL